MRTRFALLLFATLFCVPDLVRAQEDTNKIPAEIQRLAKNLKYRQGEIDLRGGLAKLTVPKDFNYLDPEDTETVLVKFWGNPPSPEKPLGMLMPAGLTPLNTNCWVVTIEYREDGYVKDSDASKINYNDLLKKMRNWTVKGSRHESRGQAVLFNLNWAA